MALLPRPCERPTHRALLRPLASDCMAERQPTRLEHILDAPLAHTEKGMPPVPGIRIGDIADKDWNVLREDMTFPIALLRERELEHNAQWMAEFASQQAVWLYPHGKTTMAPQLFDLQLRHGCRGITAANTTHAEIYVQSGVRSVFLANQVTGKQALLRLRNLCNVDRGAEFFLIVDSEFNARELATTLADQIVAGQVKPLIELGAFGGRTGVRTATEAVELAKLMAGMGVHARGLEAFEGIFNMNNPAQAEGQVRQLLDEMRETFRWLLADGLLADGERYISAGGSWFYDLVASYFSDIGVLDAPHVIVRAGCTISHDSGLCKRAFSSMLGRGVLTPEEHLLPALEVWAQVQSRPEPGRAFANAGKRDLSHDVELPVVRWWYRPGLHAEPQPVEGLMEVTALNDQHAYLELSEDVDVQIGDMVGFGISHPCTTFDKWKYLYTVNAAYDVTGAIKTFF